MKQRETVKLFYNKYAYKIVIRNDLTGIFASFQGKDHARKIIEGLEADHAAGRDLYIQRWRGNIPVTTLALTEARIVYDILQAYPDHRIRVENVYGLTIYATTDDLITELVKHLKYSVKEVWRPKEGVMEFLNTNIETAILKTPMPYEFRVYFNWENVDPSFALWLEKNTDKSRVGRVTLDSIKRGGWLSGNYFYIKNEKVLTMIRMLVGHNIRKVERLVYIGDIDQSLQN
jgi:hypothetical protein